MKLLDGNPDLAECERGPMWSKEIDREVGKAVIDWFIGVLKYYRRSQWEEKPIDPKWKRGKKHVVRLNAVKRFQNRLVLNPIDGSEIVLECRDGPFSSYGDVSQHVQIVRDVVENIVRNLDDPESKKRIREIGYAMDSF